MIGKKEINFVESLSRRSSWKPVLPHSPRRRSRD